MSPTLEARARREKHMRYWISGTATLAIAAIVGLIYLGYALRRIDENRRHSDAQNAALIASNRDKFAAALALSNVQTTYSVNKSVCLLRLVAKQQIMRLEKIKSPGYKDAEKFWQGLLENQIPIPYYLNCNTLPKKPPYAAPPTKEG